MDSSIVFSSTVSSLEELLIHNKSGGFRTEAITELTTEFSECTDKVIFIHNVIQKRYYNRDTIAALNSEIH